MKRPAFLWNLFGTGLLLVLAAFAGCGRKGDPVAPLTQPAENIRDLKAVLGCQSIQLNFSVPLRRTDGTPLEPPFKVEIFRRRYQPATPVPTREATVTPTPQPKRRRGKNQEAETAPSSAPSPPPPQAAPAIPAGAFDKIADVVVGEPSPRPSPSPGNPKGPTPTPVPPTPVALSWIDRAEKEPFEPGYSYLYQLVVVDQDGEVSAPSNTVQVSYAIVPGPPEGLAGRSTAQGIELAWRAPVKDCAGQPVTGLEGYNVYRKPEGGAYSAVPINQAIVAEPKFLDKGFDRDKTYWYSVRAVAPSPRRESAGSREAKIEASDVYPPEPATGLVVTRSRAGVELLWNPSPSSDVVGYHIERALGAAWTRLTEVPEPKTSYRDATAEPRKKYRYRVIAVDGSIRANTSIPSEEVLLDEP